MKNVLETLVSLAKKIPAMLRRNWGYKLLALIFAIVLWISVMASTNPVRTKTLIDIPVSIENLNVIRNNGLTLSKSTEDYSNFKAKVVVDVYWNDYGNVDERNVALRVDLSGVTEPGAYDLPIAASYSGDVDGVSSISPATLSVTVEEFKSRTVPVEVVAEGELAGGYWAGDLKITPGSISVQGPESLVDTINKAQTTYPLGELVSDYRAARSFVLLDESGAEVDSSAMIFSNNNVILEQDIRPTREVPVLAEASVIGGDALPDGYEMTGIEVYPHTVTVAAPADVLEGVVGLGIPVVDISGATSDVSGTVTLEVPDGVRLLGRDIVDIIVRIQEIEITRTFTDLSITIRGLSDELEAGPINQTAAVTVTGPLIAMDDLTASGVKLYIDVGDLGPGTYTLDVRCDIDEKYRVREADISVSTADVIITGK